MSYFRRVYAACRRRASGLIATATLLGACAEPHEDVGDISLTWDEGGGEWGAWLRGTDLLQSTLRRLEDEFKLPGDVSVVVTRCDKKNASYGAGQITMCYELLQAIVAVDSARDVSDEATEKRVRATWLLVFLHEFGHALADLYDLPIPTGDEATVDNFAAIQLLAWQRDDYLQQGAEYWKETAPAHYTEQSFSGEHPPDLMRFYDAICILYGSKPGKHARLVTEGVLPKARAERCPDTYRESQRAWDIMLGPWRK